jgi:hypothetical protein
MNHNFLLMCLWPLFAVFLCIRCEHTLSDFNSSETTADRTDVTPTRITPSERLSYCYPNPANQGETLFICFPVIQNAEVGIEILDPEEVQVSINFLKIMSAGMHSFPWYLSNVDPGVYAVIVTINYENGKHECKTMRVAVRGQ